MNRLSIIAALVAFAIFATLLMFLTALVTSMLGSTAIFFAWIICVPVVCLLFCGGLAVMFVILSNALHSLKLRRLDEEHYFQVLREKRELDLQKHELQLHLYRLRISRGVHLPRRPRLKRRPPDVTENGC
ncbi:MAG TPA: hypothetical protein VK140_17120 [Ktedonobacteraceae bacterium]|nr:hypothetical protein [Ktedonobacteraceae bacterium]